MSIKPEIKTTKTTRIDGSAKIPVKDVRAAILALVPHATLDARIYVSGGYENSARIDDEVSITVEWTEETTEEGTP